VISRGEEIVFQGESGQGKEVETGFQTFKLLTFLGFLGIG
jgi:hypothetical protein